MPETPTNKKERENKSEQSSWSEDQKKRGYYYDDAHGYEIYLPEDDAEDCETGKGTTSNDRAKAKLPPST